MFDVSSPVYQFTISSFYHLIFFSLLFIITKLLCNLIIFSFSFNLLLLSYYLIILLSYHFIILLGMLSTLSICYKVDMGLGIVVGVAITKAIHISRWIKNVVQNTQLKALGNTKLIGQGI